MIDRVDLYMHQDSGGDELTDLWVFAVGRGISADDVQVRLVAASNVVSNVIEAFEDWSQWSEVDVFGNIWMEIDKKKLVILNSYLMN